MLSALHIENIAVVESADIEFDEGFNVLTGETGAGKTTTMQTISGLLRSKTGDITFMESSIFKTEPHKIVALGLAQVPEGLVDGLVHGLQGVGLPAQVQIRRPVELVSPCAHPEREFLPIHAIASFHLLEFPAGDFHCGRGKFFKMQEKSRSPGAPAF